MRICAAAFPKLREGASSCNRILIRLYYSLLDAIHEKVSR
jgi:hypothetical protein